MVTMKYELFRKSILSGDLGIAKILLARDPSLVRGRNANGLTALHEMAAAGKTELAELLIDHGHDVSATNKDRLTPLHMAGSASIVELLVRRGANVNAHSKYCWTPLHVQAQKRGEPGALEVMKALLRAGADPNLRDVQGDTPLNFAFGDSEKLEVLTTHGALSDLQ